MTSRRETDRRGERDPNFPRKQPASADHPDQRDRKKPQLNEYFIQGEGINRQVLQSEICKYLGADAYSRPGDYNGVPGFKIRALRPFTPEMLNDLRAASRDFDNENRVRSARYREEVPYEESETRNKMGGPTEERFANHGPPSSSGHAGGYPSSISSPYSQEQMPSHLQTRPGYHPSESGYHAQGEPGYPAPGGYQVSSYDPRATQYPQPGGYTQAPSYPNPLASSMGIAGSGQGYPPNYVYSRVERDPRDQREQGYRPTGQPAGYVEPRPRADVPPGYYEPRSDRENRMPHYDTSMGGMPPTTSAGYGAPPSRIQQPSPYDDSRDPYASSRQPPNFHAGGRR